MVKTLKMSKCLRRYALLRVVHTVWSVSQVLISKNVYLKEIRFVIQRITMSQRNVTVLIYIIKGQLVYTWFF